MEKRQLCCGSNLSTAVIRPNEPSWMRSWMLTPLLAYFLAIETTSLQKNTRIQGEIWGKVGCDIWEKWVRWAGGKKREKQEYKVGYGKSGVRHMGEMGCGGRKQTNTSGSM